MTIVILYGMGSFTHSFILVNPFIVCYNEKKDDCMLLNVSGRCDIVAFFSEWFIHRYRSGFVDVRNPFYPKQITRIYFKDVDAIIFCTKNPTFILPYLDEIKIPYLFQITLTPYQKDIEPNVRNKRQIITSIQKLSKKIGKENVYIRYDPIFLNSKYTISYHIKSFETLCSLLEGFINHIIISFIDIYKNVEKHAKELNIKPFTEEDYEAIGKHFSRIAAHHKMTVQTCSEEKNLLEYGFIKNDCVSRNLAFRLTGKTHFKKWNSRNQKNCNCVEMIDIGAYNSCFHLCKYCYANYDESKIYANMRMHNPNSSLLLGEIKEEDTIKVKTT